MEGQRARARQSEKIRNLIEAGARRDPTSLRLLAPRRRQRHRRLLNSSKITSDVISVEAAAPQNVATDGLS